MLTPRQSQLIRYIEDHIEREGHSPTYEQMRAAIGLTSRGGVHRMLGGLVERGFVTRSRGHKSVTIVRSLRDVARGSPVSDDPLVRFIHLHQAENHGQTPSYRQIALAVGASSISVVSRRLASLDREGAIVQSREGRHRMIHVVKTNEQEEDHNDA